MVRGTRGLTSLEPWKLSRWRSGLPNKVVHSPPLDRACIANTDNSVRHSRTE